jgi:hypothetical protein
MVANAKQIVEASCVECGKEYKFLVGLNRVNLGASEKVCADEECQEEVRRCV